MVTKRHVVRIRPSFSLLRVRFIDKAESERAEHPPRLDIRKVAVIGSGEVDNPECMQRNSGGKVLVHARHLTRCVDFFAVVAYLLTTWQSCAHHCRFCSDVEL